MLLQEARRARSTKKPQVGHRKGGPALHRVRNPRLPVSCRLAAVGCILREQSEPGTAQTGPGVSPTPPAPLPILSVRTQSCPLTTRLAAPRLSKGRGAFG